MMAPLAARLTLVHLSVVVWMIYSCAAGVTRHKPCDTDRGWKSHGSKCYKKMDTTNGWLGARHDCLWEAGDLVSITSEEEEKFVKEQMGDKPFWIGLSNRVCNKDGCQEFRAGEKRLNWSDTGVTPTYTNWDSRQDGSSNDESCAYVNQGVHTGSQPGKWRHGSCGSSLAYMCERSPDDCPDGWPCSYKDLGYTYSRVETSYCDSGEFLYKDSCYHFEGRQVIWQEAEDLCKEEGGLLASVHSKVDGQFLAVHRRTGLGLYSWLGLKNNNGKFVWRDGSSTDDVPWADPKYSGDCTKLNNAGEVELETCTDTRPSICQKGKARDPLQLNPESGSGSTDHEAGTCDTVNGWSPHGSNCYKKMSTTNGWLGARHDCLWEGGDLVSITSEDEEKFVKEQMGDKAFWIGVSNLVCDKDWCRFFEAGEKRLTWSDTGVTPTYANWASSQGGSPNDESCAYVNQGVHIYSQPGKWRHGSCGSSLAYMCKRSPGDCPEGWPCSYKDFGHTYSRVETSYCNSGEFLYKDSCYHFEGRNGTWQAAEDFCKKERGLLASVHSKVDGQFLAAHQRIAWYSWLGLKKNNGKFEWRDGSSTDDIPWHHEKFLGVCTKLSGAGEVAIASCTSVTRPSICQKGKARASLPPLPASASASDKSAKCGLWWENPANDFCYMINAMPTKTWKEARDECARRRGNLLAITDLQELNFIHGLPASGSSLWLDASDTNVEVGSKQSDESSPSSVLLAASDPGDPPGRRCNSLLHGKGSMEVVDCDKKSGYVCRRRGIQTCEMTKGWRGFGSNCYRKMKTTNGWLGARYDCVWEGGDLVSITSEDEQKFVMEQMGDKPFWIGLSNLDCAEVWCQFFKTGEKRLTWSDTALTPTYAKWTSSQDGSSDDESCTYVNQGVHVDSQPGKWRHGSCGSSLMYMCERPLDACPDGRLCSYKDYGNGYNRVETSYCDTGEFLYRDSCYHFEGLERTWEAAERFCEEWHGGHLASVQSLVDGQFLAANAPYAGGVQSWVGLKNNKDNFEWSDATSTGNILWVPNGPKGRGGCSALSPTGQLEDWSCTESRPFICKKAKVQEFLLPPPAGWSAKCGWWVDRSSSSDFCYLIQHKPTKTWQKARDDCLRRGGDLLSIADSNEQAFAQGLYSSLSSAPSLWLGVNNKKDDSEWTDGSPLGYMLMDRDDPGDLSGASCLSLLTSNGRWKFDDCRKKRGYICKKRGIPAKPQQPLPALTHHEPTCDIVNGWSPHGSNCYKKMETPNGWLGARHDCLWEGGDLVSITSEDEEMFVMEQMGNKPFWIGLSNLNCNETWCQFFKAGEKSVTWSYTSVMPTYANWDPREDQSFNDESCAYVNQGVHGDSRPSKWRRGSCGSSLVYMCERSPDDCPDGWPCSYKDLAYSYSRVETSYCDSNEFLYKDSCYHFEGTPKTWQAAEDFCKEEGGLLASVHSKVDGQFLAALVREGSQPWLGLKKTTALKSEWLDGSSTDNVTKNPTQNADDCAKLNENGEIQLEGCTGLGPSICQKGKARTSLQLLPASASASGKSAKCGWWRENPANDFCYLINAMATKTWKEARDECARLRGNLLAITDSNEHTFVRGLLPSGSSSWLDASDIIVEVGSEQSDESSQSSFLLGASNPGDPSGRRCNSLLSGKGGVEVADCEKKRGYVCKRRVVQTCERTKGWRRFGSNCYKKMETTNGWLGARYDCVWEGGDLVSITSEDEQSFVKEQMGDKPFWIGRSNLNCDVAWCQFFEAGEKRLSLSDTGVTPTYANWDSRQDRSPNDESCAYVNQGVHVDSQPGKWRHGSCGSSLAYMCERPLDACPDGRLCSYKDYGIGRNRVETSYCNPGDFLYKDSCYHFEGMKRTWEAAERFCEEWNGHLASVHSLVDSQFLTAHASYVGGVQSWVGLKKNKDNFEWSDATPTGNIAWVLNRPTGLGDCCALSPTGQIEDWPCTNNRPFICKKAKVQEIVLPPPAGWSAKCGWWPDRSSSDFCYLIQHNPTKTWQEARDDCRRRGGDLLSITDSHEQAFIQSLYTSLSSAPSLWLGANNKIMKDGSQWTDGFPFGYVLMDGDDPGDLNAAPCLSLLTSNGRWTFDDCRKKRGYICKKRGIPAKPQQPLPALTHHEPTCDTVNGWSPHGSNCYKKMETPNGWLGARHDCLWEGGDLVSITSEEEEKFVKKQMGDKPFWIGLSNLNCNETWCQFFKAGEKSVTWSYTSVTPTYANWDPRQDQSFNDESCAYVNQGVHGDSQSGKWRRGSCGSSLVYMCERSSDDCPDGWPCSYKDLGYSYSRVETSFCDSNEFLYKDSCYHFEGTPKTWQAAEDFCKEEGGLLASVRSPVDRRFLAAHVQEGSQPWLGLKKTTALKFEWLDGSSTDNVTKNPTQKADDCAKLNENGEIQLEGCTGLHSSICQKGKARASLPLLPASASASGKSAKCGWWRENPANDFCYLINAMPTKTWKEARDECARLRGNLLAITDSNEHTFVRGLLPSGSSLWLDASDIIVEVGSEQSDESSQSSFLLGASNPGDPPGRRCNSLLSGKGGVEVGDCEKKRGYVCKRRVVQTCGRTKGWRRFGSNCYKKMETTNGWLGARYDCVWEGGDLVSITSEDEQSFVKEQMGDKPFWIGRSNLKCDVAWCQFFEAGEKRLSLSDTGVTPTYANWDSRQDRSPNDESCAYVNQGVHVDSQPGTWRHGSCGSSLAYMCERPLDACPDGRLCSYKDYGIGRNRVETSYCNPGDFLYKDSCYHFEGMKRTWEAAERFCEEWNGHLASVHSLVDSQFLAAHAGGVQSWVGLKKNKDNFEWSDATPTGNIAWVLNRPTGRGDCCALLPTGQVEDWPCTNIRPFICKKAKVQEFLLPPPAGWSAKCGWWPDRFSSDFCYLIQRRPTKTWKEARDDCLRRGGDLLSITNSHEQAFIQSLYTFLPSSPSLWLGVNNNITKDGSEWTDGSPFGYVLMDGDDPGDLNGAPCLSLLTSNGRWKFDDCRKKRGYICKKRGNSPKPSKPHDGFKEILVCDNHSADLVCEDEGQKQGRISIQSAFYGRRSDNVCLVDSDSYDDEYCAVEGILPRYRKMCNGHQKCHIELLEDDSCPATSKYLEMVYSCEHKASSSMEDATPEKARLNGESCWKPAKDAVGSWIQVNLGYMRKVTGIVTKGCDSANIASWNIQLEMQLSVNRRKWTKHADGKFIGGGTHLLETPAFAKYVRILPLESHPEFGLRFDILGCAHDDAMTCARQFNSLHLTDSMTFYCPPGCAKDKHFVFGTLVYSKDSHICAAAIHAGVIQNDIGGDCIVMRAPKQPVYTGFAGNGIISRHSDDPLGDSYTFADGERRCSAPDWEEFAGFCYKFFEDVKNWDDAQRVCRGFGAELMSIRSKVEQAWVRSASEFETSDMWTGLNDLVLPGMFVWSDRHKVTFTHWAAGEPYQRVGLGKHCVAQLWQTGKWKLMSCAQVNSFMCKMPKVHFPITSSKPQVAQ
ncbi:uncharacterized protein LOC133163674 isoform X2 [Syngnathus typhle]|uniref:uncharacterized protein LOC133163674 isoform X2 n=1 Tax=Syngnathus typhle TaxID=161592 RepID=UPI002A6B0A09|nr:uncharacterized protein LOC133163674 isoform X2 [Syngnathus typhle]